MACEVSFDRGAVCRTALVLTFFKLSVGMALLACAVLGMQNTREDSYGSGPPYYVGGFVCSPLLFIGCILDGCVVQKAKSIDADSQSDRSAFRSAVVPETVFAVLAIFGCFPGFFCVAWGVSGCDTEDPPSFNSCDYTINVEQNQLLAILILVCLLLTAILGLSTVFFVHSSSLLQGIRDACKRDGNPFCRSMLRRGGVITVQNTYTYGSIGEAARQDVTGVHPDVIHHPTTTAYMTGTTNSGAPIGGVTNVGGGGQVNADSDTEAARIRRLEEENRLLREQLDLRQQLGQPQQPQPQPYYAGEAVPPPSYSDVVTQPEKDDHFLPSAPPM